MELIGEYVERIGGFLIFQTVAELLLPNHTSRKYIRFLFGAVFVLLLLQPITELLQWSPELDLGAETMEGGEYSTGMEELAAAEYRERLLDYGLPEGWQTKWGIAALEVTCEEARPMLVAVELVAQAEAKEDSSISISLGTIGWEAGEQEAEGLKEEELMSLREELAAYWGIELSGLHLSIRGG